MRGPRVTTLFCAAALLVVALLPGGGSAAAVHVGSFRTRPAGLWPKPKSASSAGAGALSVDANRFDFTLTSGGSVSSGEKELLQRAFGRYAAVLFGGEPSKKGLHRSDTPVVAVDGLDGVAGDLVGLRVHVAQGVPGGVIQLGTDESYTLFVNSSHPTGLLEAPTVFGALRGLETFSQLAYGAGVGDSSAGPVMAQQMTVRDSPRFAWRGLLLDTSRHYLPVDTLKRLIDALPANKMNTLHWHVVDGQSFPLVSTSPLSNRLSMGAYAPSMIYRPEDVEGLVAYANDRGVRLLPEFDMPAHATSWGYGYPELICNCSRFASQCTPEPHAPHNYGDGCGDDPFNPTLQSTYDLLNDFLGEMAGRFPDNFVHLGGDELSYREQCWNTTNINEFMAKNGLKTYLDLEGYFIHKVQGIADKVGKQVLHWQEIFNNHISMPKNKVIVHVWKDHPTLDKIVNDGFRGILSFGWYLDHLATDWQSMYLNEPIDKTLSPEAAKRVLGGEACMWGEKVDETNVESRIWPRASAVAERLWSEKDVTSIPDAQTRLHDQRCRMLARGARVEPFQPGWCY